MRIVVTGSLAFDFIMNFPGKFSDHILADKIHKINLSFSVDEMRRGRGGCAGNIAYNLSLLGGRPLIVGVLGRDGRNYARWLKRRGVNVSQIFFSKKNTATAFVMTDRADNQLSSFYLGASEVRRLSLKKLKFKPDLVMISPTNPLVMKKFVKECQELGIDYLYDPGMQLPRFTAREVTAGVKGAKMVIGNDYEMELIKQRTKTMPAGRPACRAGKQVWITTLGAKGSVIEYQGKKIKIPPAKPKNESDPTGAGDAYRAGFVWAYFQGMVLEKAGRVGSLVAAYTVEKYGTTTHRFTMREFKKRYKEDFGQEF